jgi:PhoPQ-activated pathogenicity-related protein
VIRDRVLFILVLTIGTAATGFSQPPATPDVAPPPDLANYVRKADASYAWKLAGKTSSDTGTVYELDLTSQTWHDITWTHKIQVFVPKGAKPQRTMVLWNQGGKPSAGSGLLGLKIAEQVGAPVAFLYGVPNQPLLGGKSEDALIAETFVRYLETKDSTWPLLFPMVKSVTRAMDALQAFAKAEWQADVKDFVVTGASKRGWTSWLTAASGDTRVKAIAPLVIDTLNFPVQMKNQLTSFGKPSLMIHDYTERNLVPIPDTGDGRHLWRMVDPWIYRHMVTVPKMIINGANDPYWPLDALNSYWDDLKGEKYILYVPNAGHNLRQKGEDGKDELLPMRAVSTLSAFCKCQVFDKKMPTYTWKYTAQPNGMQLEVGYEGTVKSQRLWTADSPTRDFRPARWSERVLLSGSATVEVSSPVSRAAAIPLPETGFRAMFAETEFRIGDLAFPLSTQIRILEAKK